MSEQSLRIVFMGTPEFAVPSLRILIESGYEVVGVITATDKLGGRGRKQLLQSEVKQYAVAQGIPVLQPKNLKNEDFLAELRALRADLQVVVAFRMLPVVVWDMPPLGTFNLHGSLLPKYRGAAPINWAIIRGETETGVTTFFLQHAIDTGNILLQRSLPIGENDTLEEVYHRLMELGARTTLETVQLIEQGDYTPIPQDDAQATSAPKIFTEDCEINFAQSTLHVHNFVRGMSPFPCAWTTWKDTRVKVYRTLKSEVKSELSPGSFFVYNRKHLHIATSDGSVEILDLQMQGRKRSAAIDFINGFRTELPAL